MTKRLSSLRSSKSNYSSNTYKLSSWAQLLPLFRGEKPSTEKKVVKRVVQRRDPFIFERDWEPLKEFLLNGGFRSVLFGRVLISFFIMGTTGLRVNEVRLMTWKQITQLVDSTSTVVTNVKRIGKRRISLATKHKEQLAGLLRTCQLFYFNGNFVEPKDHFVLGYAKGLDPEFKRPVANTTFDRSLNAALKKAVKEIPEFNDRFLTTHSFRIGLVTYMRSKYTRLEDIKSFIGHASVATTELYDRYEMDEERRIALLDSVFTKKGSND